MELILVVSGRGGCGRSALSVGLASVFAAHGERVLVVEAASGFRFLDYALGLSDRTAMDFSDLLCGRCAPEQAVLHHAPSGIDVLLAPGSVDFVPRAEQLAQFAAGCREAGYHRVFFDCPPGFGAIHRALAGICPTALLIATPDLACARHTATVAAQLAAVGVLDQRLILNRVCRTIPESAGIDDLDEVIDIVGARLYGVIPQQKSPTRIRLTEESSAKAVYHTAARLAGKSIPLLPMFL